MSLVVAWQLFRSKLFDGRENYQTGNAASRTDGVKQYPAIGPSTFRIASSGSRLKPKS